MRDANPLRRAFARLLRPAGLLVLFLTEVLLAEGGSLSAAVALAATAAMRLRAPRLLRHQRPLRVPGAPHPGPYGHQGPGAAHRVPPAT